MRNIINNLKMLCLQHCTVLFDPHPLLAEPEAVKLHYLAFVALPIATNRTNDVLAKSTFLALAKSLNINKDDGLKIWQERDNILDENISKVINQLITTETQCACLCDSIWIQKQQAATASNEKEDQQAIALIAKLLGIHNDLLVQLYNMLVIIATQKQIKVDRLPDNKNLISLLSQPIAQAPQSPDQFNCMDWQDYQLLYRQKKVALERPLNYIALNFSADGSKLLGFMWDNDNTPQLIYFETDTGKELQTINLQHEIRLDKFSGYALSQFSNDRQWVFYQYENRSSGKNKSYFHLHNAKTGEHLYKFKSNDWTPSGSFSPNSQYLAIKEAVLNLNSLNSQPLSKADGYIVLTNELAIAKHSKGGIALWNLQTGDYIKHLTKLDYYPIDISSDSIWLLVDKLQQINLSTGKLRWKKAIEGKFSNACYSPNGALLAAIHKENIIIYDAATGEQITLFAHTVGDVHSLNFSPNNKQLLVSGLDKTNRQFCLFSCTSYLNSPFLNVL